jgi:Site-specific recombinase XerD
MPKKQKIDFASLFPYEAKRGLYYAHRTINGRRLSFRSKDPEALFHKVESAIATDGVAPTFETIADEWQDEKWPTIAFKTQECYKSPYNRAVKEYGTMKIDEITAADVNRIILRMKNDGFAAQTVKDQKAVLNMIFNFAIAHDPPYLKINPCTAVKVPRGLSKKKRSAPDDPVIQRIHDSVDKATFGLFPFLLIYTGCRRGEALALTWGDVDTKEKLVHITKAYTYENGMPVLGTTKTVSGVRDVPLLPGLEAHLKRPRGAEDTKLIFPGPHGGPLQENAYRRRWRQYCIDANLTKTTQVEKTDVSGKPYLWDRVDPEITPHQLRHAYATILFESNLDELTAKDFLGHADVHTTKQIYTDLRSHKKKNEVKKFSSYMARHYDK